MSKTRETAKADMHQVLPGLVKDIASVRAEDSSSFAQTLKKKKAYHAAAGDSAIYLVKHPVCVPTT